MKTKKEKRIIFCLIIIGMLGLLFGVRLLQAKIIYNDMRCVFVKCRIQIDHNP